MISDVTSDVISDAISDVTSSGGVNRLSATCRGPRDMDVTWT